MQIESKSCESVTECAICLQECVHAVRLMCNHIFCYLCIKGAANQSNRCAVCRQQIPNNYFQNPILIDGIDSKDMALFDDQFQWLYEGRNGWWLYDMRTSQDIEDAFKQNQSNCELLIAGFLYVIDFERMIQYRRYEPNRIRRIRRDRLDLNSAVKGVAGLRTNLNDVIQQQSGDSVMNNETSDAEESTQLNGEEVLESDESTQTNNTSHQRLQQIEPEVQRDSSSGGEGHENGANNSNGEYSDADVVQLEQLLTNSLTIRDTRETYL